MLDNLRSKRDFVAGTRAERSGLTLEEETSVTPSRFGSLARHRCPCLPFSWGQFRDEFSQLGSRSAFNSEFPEANKDGLGTFMGVYVPTLNSFIGFIAMTRWGWAVGNAGMMGSLSMLLIAGVICIITISSASAISTNEKVGAGGAYYMISRALGPQFGGSSGALFFLAQALTCTLNVLGLAETIRNTVYGEVASGGGWDIQIVLYSLLISVGVLFLSLLGARFFARVSLVIMIFVLAALLLTVLSFARTASPDLQTALGFSPGLDTLRGNMWSQYSDGESFLSVFGVLMTSMVGVLAGANMSGNLRDPSVSIPSGTLWSLLTTLAIYAVLIVAQAFSFSRSQLQSDYLVLQNISVVPSIYFAATALATFSSAFGGFVGAAKVLAAVAEDELFSHTKWFAFTGVDREPRRAMIFTFGVSTLAIFSGNVNALAPALSAFFFLTFGAINLACALLHLSRTPFFRPQFKFFSWKISLVGVFLCLYTTFITDAPAALLSFAVALLAFVYLCNHKSPKANDWEQITQSLLFKVALSYVLRLDSRKKHVKNWRPQILAMTHDPTNPQGLLAFGDQLKKRGLYVIGHVVTGSPDPYFPPLLNRIRSEALSALNHAGITAQLEIVISPSFALGTQSLIQISGMGGLKPNTLLTSLPPPPSSSPPSPSLPPATNENETFGLEPISAQRGGGGGGGGGGGEGEGDWPQPDVSWGEIQARDWHEGVLIARNFGCNLVVTNGLANWNQRHKASVSETIDVWLSSLDLGLLPLPADIFDLGSGAVEFPTALNRITKMLEYSHCFRSNKNWRDTHMRAILISRHEYPGNGQDLERTALIKLLKHCRIPAEIIIASFSQLNSTVDPTNDPDEIFTDGPQEQNKLTRASKLNSIFRLHSSAAGVVFIQPETYPEDESVTREREGEGGLGKYIEELHILCDGLPPTALIFTGPLHSHVNLKPKASRGNPTNFEKEGTHTETHTETHTPLSARHRKNIL